MTTLVLILAVVLGLWGARARRRPAYALLGGLAAGAIGVGLVLNLPDWHPPSVRLSTWLALLGLGLFAAEVIGTPPSIALRTGIGRHSKEWLYDTQMIGLFTHLNRVLEAEPADSRSDAHDRWRAEVRHAIDRAIRRARRLHVPSPEWQRLTDDYIETYESIAQLAEGGEDNMGLREAIQRSNTRLGQRLAELRAEYRSAPGARLD